MILQPLKNIPKYLKKIVQPNEFRWKIMGGNKIENLPIILEAKLSLYVSIYYENLRREYPPKSSFNDDGTSQEHIFFGRAQTIFPGDKGIGTG